MKKATWFFMVMFVFCFISCGERGSAPNRAISGTLDNLFKQLSIFEYGHDAELIIKIDDAVRAAQNDRILGKDIEQRLIALLDSEATIVGKMYACQKLNIIGSALAVPALAKQLNSPELAHMARSALENMPDPAVEEALRAALGAASQEMKIGIVYCLGNRKDSRAVDVLLPLIDDSDSPLAVAAIYALGKIGTSEAGRGLMDKFSKKSDKLQPDVLDAHLRIGESLIKSGNLNEAVKIYESLYQKDQPDYVRLAGFKGLVDAQPEKARELLYRALDGGDDKMRGLAARFISERSPDEDIKYFVNSLERLQPSGQVALIDALSSRNETTAAPAVRKMVKSPKEEVRIAALAALGKIGQSSDVMLLAETTAARRGAESKTALQSIVDMKGETVNSTLMSNLDGAGAEVRVVLINGLMMRVAVDADKEIVRYLDGPDENVRSAAVSAIGKIGGANHIPALVASLKKTEREEEKANIDKALKSICGRTGENSSPNILAAYQSADTSLRLRLLDQFSLVGSPETLEVLRSLIADKDEALKDAGVRAIASWPNANALADLESIAKNSEKLSHSVLGFRGYIRLVRALDESDEMKVKRLLGSSSQLVRRPEEAKLILAAFGAMRGSLDALKAVERYLSQKDVADEAMAALLNIAETLDAKLKVDIELALRQVCQATDNQTIIQRVERIAGRYNIPMRSLMSPKSSPAEKGKK